MVKISRFRHFCRTVHIIPPVGSASAGHASRLSVVQSLRARYVATVGHWSEPIPKTAPSRLRQDRRQEQPECRVEHARATGINATLYPNAQTRFCRMFDIVRLDTSTAFTTPRRSPDIKTTSADSIATSVPVPMAMPTSAYASAGASLMPSPTKAILRPSPSGHRALRPFRPAAHRRSHGRSRSHGRWPLPSLSCRR